MKILILETSTEKGCLVLAEDENLIEAHPLPGGPELSKRLGTEVSELLKRRRFTPDWIAVGTGPGSYTGIRVGAALAKALSYGWQVPLLGYCSLKAFAPSKEGTFAILIDARSTGLYVLFGEKKGTDYLFQEPSLLSPADPALQTVACLASPHPDAIQKRGSFSSIFKTGPDPQLLARIVYRQYLTEGITPLQLNYGPQPI